MNTLTFTVATCAGLTLLAPLTTDAADPTNGWQPGFTLAPYGWLAGIEGTVESPADDPGDGGPDLPPQFEISTDEEWSEIGFMFYGEWRGERWTAFFDTVWANVSQEADIKLGNLLPSSEAEVTFDGNIYQLGIGYRLLDWERSFVTLYGGGRYYDVEAEIAAGGGILPGEITASDDLSWSDAVLGARWSHDFGQRWNASVLADYGFGDSESAWQIFGTVSYAFSWGSILGGYRHMDLDYDTSGSTINLSLSGPFVGASFSF
jgi:hypothetical protein